MRLKREEAWAHENEIDPVLLSRLVPTAESLIRAIFLEEELLSKSQEAFVRTHSEQFYDWRALGGDYNRVFNNGEKKRLNGLRIVKWSRGRKIELTEAGAKVVDEILKEEYDV